MTTTKKNDVAANLAACAAGLVANYPDTQTWVFNQTTYKRGDILGLLQACMQAAQKTRTDHDAWRGSVEAEREELAKLHPVLGALKKALEAEWGATSVKMAEFGFEPAKPRTKAVAGKAAGAEKARATRKAKKAALASVNQGAAPAPAAPQAAAAPAASPAPGAAGPTKGS